MNYNHYFIILSCKVIAYLRSFDVTFFKWDFEKLVLYCRPSKLRFHNNLHTQRKPKERSAKYTRIKSAFVTLLLPDNVDLSL